MPAKYNSEANIEKTRAALGQMAAVPRKGQIYSRNEKRRFVGEIYAEVRAARLAGYTWEDIAKCVRVSAPIAISSAMLTCLFREWDLHYEAETGEPALPLSPRAAEKEKRRAQRKIPVER